jgi:hypothetical protein
MSIPKKRMVSTPSCCVWEPRVNPAEDAYFPPVKHLKRKTDCGHAFFSVLAHDLQMVDFS